MTPRLIVGRLAAAALLGTAIVAAPPTLAAQAPAAPAAGQPLSLAEALRLAERGNPQYRQTLNDPDASAAARRAAYGAYLPKLDLNVGFDGAGSETLTGEDEFGAPVRGARRTIRSSSARQGLSLSMTLYDGGMRERRIGAAREDLRAAEADVFGQRARLHADVATQYFRVQAAHARLVLEERLLATARDQFEATQRRFRIAAANREDVLGSEADVARAEAQLETARGEVRKAMLLLRQQLGLGATGELTLTDSIPRPAADVALDADSLVRLALAQHPLVAAAQARADAAAANVRVARGARWPSVIASAGVSRSDRANDFGTFGELDPRGAQGFSFGLSTSLPVFDRFQTGSAIAQAEARAEDAREGVRAERLRIEQEVRAAVIDIENARRALRLGERAAELSRERVELAQARYEAGAMDFVQFQTVLRSAADAERQEADARLQHALAWVQLRQRLGTPVDAAAGAP